MIGVWQCLAAHVAREMTFGAWVMLVVAILLLFGGLALTIRKAVLVDRGKREAGIRYEDDG